jgi:succinate-semialdehyde dehydrogenase/glutarate-semialdehyde dehydrogenase
MPLLCRNTFAAVDGEGEAAATANGTAYGLGASVWDSNDDRARRVVRRLRSGRAFANAIVASRPHRPFGGVECSGYGRELIAHGTCEFTNGRAVWLGTSASAAAAHSE